MKGSKKSKRKPEDAEVDVAQHPESSLQEETATVDASSQVEAKSEAAGQPAVEDAISREALLEERLIRLQADFENFRKRTLREKEDLYRRANEDFMLELLPVLDHLDLAFGAAGETGLDHPLVKGFALVGEQLRQALQKFGLSEVASKDGIFDPNVHEAIQHLPSDTVPEDGLIACTRAGYMLGNRLLRAAQVVVSSGPRDDAESVGS